MILSCVCGGTIEVGLLACVVSGLAYICSYLVSYLWNKTRG